MAGMSGLNDTVEIELLDVQHLEIHGSRYYQLRYRVAGSQSEGEMRINPEAFYPDPQPGDRARVNLLMGNIMNAEKL